MKKHPVLPTFFSTFCLAVSLMLATGNISAAAGHWVTTWAAAPYLVKDGYLPPSPLAFNTTGYQAMVDSVDLNLFTP